MFNITQFKAQMDKYKGPSRNNLFMAEFFVPVSASATPIVPTFIMPTSDMKFFCRNVSVPGINLEVFQYVPTGLGYIEHLPAGASLSEFNAVFMLDSDHKVKSFFDNWMNSIMNISSENGLNSAGLRTREINFKDNYAIGMSIKHYSQYARTSVSETNVETTVSDYYEYKFYGVYPTQVSSVNLAWDDEAISTISVSFAYNKFEFDGFNNN